MIADGQRFIEDRAGRAVEEEDAEPFASSEKVNASVESRAVVGMDEESCGRAANVGLDLANFAFDRGACHLHICYSHWKLLFKSSYPPRKVPRDAHQ